jgi:hypothetical protein
LEVEAGKPPPGLTLAVTEAQHLAGDLDDGLAGCRVLDAERVAAEAPHLLLEDEGGGALRDVVLEHGDGGVGGHELRGRGSGEDAHGVCEG